MFQQFDDDNFVEENSVLKNPDSRLPSENTSNHKKNDSFLEIEGVEEKSFSEKWKTNRFWIIKASYYVLHTVWMIAMFIGGFIAWLISLLFI